MLTERRPALAVDLAELEASVADVTEAITLPPRCYTSSEFYAFEMEAIFAREWVCVGHQAQIPNPGDYFTVTVVDDPLLVVRGQDGEIRAMSAVCRHRGAVLAGDAGDDAHARLRPPRGGAAARAGGAVAGVRLRQLRPPRRPARAAAARGGGAAGQLPPGPARHAAAGDVRAALELEDHDRERDGVLPLLVPPSRLPRPGPDPQPGHAAAAAARGQGAGDAGAADAPGRRLQPDRPGVVPGDRDAERGGPPLLHLGERAAQPDHQRQARPRALPADAAARAGGDGAAGVLVLPAGDAGAPALRGPAGAGEGGERAAAGAGPHGGHPGAAGDEVALRAARPLLVLRGAPGAVQSLAGGALPPRAERPRQRPGGPGELEPVWKAISGGFSGQAAQHEAHHRGVD